LFLSTIKARRRRKRRVLIREKDDGKEAFAFPLPRLSFVFDFPLQSKKYICK